MIILDTNVLSELTKDPKSPNVVSWALAQPDEELWTTSTTVSELELGVQLLPEGRRHSERDKAQTNIIFQFRDRIIPFDGDQAIVFGTICAARRKSGRPISRADAQIAAACVSCEAVLATRNVKDFEGIPGLELINPWESES